MSLQNKKFLNESAVSKLLGVALSTLRNKRFNRLGPKYHKFGKSVRYLESDLEAYIEGSVVDTENEG